MGPYRVEMRGQSFYLTRVDAQPATRVDQYQAALPAGDVPALRAALNQVTGNPHWTRWEDAGRPSAPDTSWTRAPGDTGPAAPATWTVTLDTDTLHITGPWAIDHESGRALWYTEIEYADVLPLRAALTKASMPTR